ncbi:MAG: bifunctional hydroxymethylpyrimidine kinase/phosphomethylpyrimidine kinase [Oscillibacter sp.]|nr:bifunctional hydroxymethylpyrimidine kinase/phosphomethylpyrimidine kinase [Oscillibacter sp.]
MGAVTVAVHAVKHHVGEHGAAVVIRRRRERESFKLILPDVGHAEHVGIRENIVIILRVFFEQGFQLFFFGGNVPLIEVIADKLAQYQAKNIVVDPVMVATSGDRLISEDALETLKRRLLPLATVLTPNVPEAEILSGREIRTYDDMVLAGKEIREQFGCAVLCKGGHNVHDANDVLIDRDGSVCFFTSERVDNPNTHGTGCTLSSAIASNLAKGYSLEDSIQRAKQYIFGALSAMLDLGKGSGPMDHMWDLRGRFAGGEV